MKRAAFAAAALVVLLLGVRGAGRAEDTPAAEAPAKESGVSIGTKAPDFTLSDIDGKPVHLADALAKGPVLLDFWALWCKPCLEGLPGTDKLRETYGPKGLTVYAVNTDSPRSSAKVKSYVKSKQFGFRVLADANGTMQRLYRFYRIPQTYLIAADGTIVYSQLGYSPGSEERIAREIEQLVGAGAGESAPEPAGQ